MTYILQGSFSSRVALGADVARVTKDGVASLALAYLCEELVLRACLAMAAPRSRAKRSDQQAAAQLRSRETRFSAQLCPLNAARSGAESPVRTVFL